MKSRIDRNWFQSRAKDVCKECEKVQQENLEKELDRAIREGFRCGVAVALKSKQLYQGYGQKRLQRDLQDVQKLIAFRPFGKDTNFTNLAEHLQQDFNVDVSQIDISTKITKAKGKM